MNAIETALHEGLKAKGRRLSKDGTTIPTDGYWKPDEDLLRDAARIESDRRRWEALEPLKVVKPCHTR